jgi:hypothetical protein
MKNPKKRSKAKNDDPASWPVELDAMIAAPGYHRLLFENERVRVLRVRIPRGETVPVHTHRWPCMMYIERWSDFIRRDEMGRIIFDSRKAGPAPEPGTAIWSAPLPPHSAENVGSGEILNLIVELKEGISPKGSKPRRSR